MALVAFVIPKTEVFDNATSKYYPLWNLLNFHHDQVGAEI